MEWLDQCVWGGGYLCPVGFMLYIFSGRPCVPSVTSLVGRKVCDH